MRNETNPASQSRPGFSSQDESSGPVVLRSAHARSKFNVQSSKSRLWTTRLAVCLLALGALLFAAYFARAPILTAIANAWIVNEPLQKADAILVPGGGIGGQAPRAKGKARRAKSI